MAKIHQLGAIHEDHPGIEAHIYRRLCSKGYSHEAYQGLAKTPTKVNTVYTGLKRFYQGLGF